MCMWDARVQAGQACKQVGMQVSICAIRHPRKDGAASALKPGEAKALERALRMFTEKALFGIFYHRRGAVRRAGATACKCNGVQAHRAEGAERQSPACPPAAHLAVQRRRRVHGQRASRPAGVGGGHGGARASQCMRRRWARGCLAACGQLAAQYSGEMRSAWSFPPICSVEFD